MDAFEKIITKFPRNLKVLDIGAFGHEGENTSVFLGKHFDKVKGFNINTKVLADSAKFPNYEMVIDNFYDYKFKDDKFDLVVTDLTIELNLLNDWCEAGIERVKNLLNPGGYWINFVMMTEHYGDPKVTPDLIRWHSEKWWGSEVPNPESVGKKVSSLKDWELIHSEAEERRPYIYWLCLKKISG